MKCRHATAKDWIGISTVLVSSYNISSKKEALATIKSETNKGHNYIVAIDGKKIAGIVTWLPHGLPKHQLAELDRIAVLPEYRGKGVAHQLLKALIQDANKCYKKNKSKLRKLYLLTHSDNTRAHRFYEKMGFTHETTLKEHYYKDKDEFVYSMFF